MVGKLIALLLFSALSCSAATRYVATDGSATSPYDTWAKAATSLVVAVAGSQDGDIILCTNGLYSGPTVVCHTQITIRSVNGPSVTTISNAATYLELYNVSLDGLTITGAAGEYPAMYYSGVGVISNCIIRNNAGTYGPTLIFTSTSRWLNCSFQNNSCSAASGGAALNGNHSSKPLIYIDSCVFSNNTAAQMGGALSLSGLVFVDRSSFLNNRANNGAAITAVSGATGLYISNSVFAYNVPAVDDVVRAVDEAQLPSTILYNCIVYGNQGDYTILYHVTARNCTIVGNWQNFANASPLLDSDGENNISYYNTPKDLSYGGFTNSCFRVSGTSTTTNNCITNAPAFVDDYATSLATPSAANCGTNFTLLASGLDGLRLQSTSPCINTGTNSPWMVGAYDFDGTNSRIQSSIVDMGSFEYVAGAAPSFLDDTAAEAMQIWWRAIR